MQTSPNVLKASLVKYSKASRQAVTALLTAVALTILAPSVFAQHALKIANDDLATYLSQDSERPLLISAHRGGPKPGFPENAIETFAEATHFGPMMIEMDVRTSKDGVLLLMHDRKLDRTTTGSGFVRDTNWSDMQELHLKDNDGNATPYKIPMLIDALRWAQGKAILSLDIKRGTRFEDVIAALKAEQAFGHALVISYNLDAALKLQSLSDKVVITATAYDIEQLQKLSSSGLDFNRAVMWTGTRERDLSLYQAIKPTGSLVQMGTLGFNDKAIDRVIAKSGDENRYMDIYKKGVDIIATDRYWAVAAAIGYREKR